MTTFWTLLLVLFTSLADTNSAKKKNCDRLLQNPGNYIKARPDIPKHDSTILYTGWYFVIDTPTGYKRQLLQSDEVYFLNSKPIMTAKNIKASEIHENWLNNEQYFWLTMRLDKEGTEKWSYATRVAITKRIAFVIDNQLLQVVTVNSQMTDGIAVLARADFSRQEVEDFKAILENEK
jgi:hypothetical protein